MKKRIYIYSIFLPVFLCLFYTGRSDAQKCPGYQGHRFVVLYDFNFHPDPYALNAGPHDAKTPLIPISHALCLEYAFNRRAAIGTSFQYFTYSSLTTSTNAPYYTTGYSGSAKIFSIYIKRFGNRATAIAPNGRYIKPEICLMFYSGTYSNPTFDPLISPTIIPYSSGPHIGFTYSIGKQTVLFNRIIFDRGLRVSLNGQAGNKFESSPDPAIDSITRNQIFNFYVGLGWLP